MFGHDIISEGMGETHGTRKRILVTGGTSGLGFEIVNAFLTDGHEVFATGRTNTRINNLNDGFHFIKVDFSDLKDVAGVISWVAGKSGSFDMIINNAGVLSPPFRAYSSDNLEYTFQVNFLSHLLVNIILVRSCRNDHPLHIITVTSPIYRYVKPKFSIDNGSEYKALRTYSESKYYMLLIGEYLKSEFSGKDLRIVNFNPGIFSSGIYRMQDPWFRRMYQVGAAFMRGPASVASRLYEIMQYEGLRSDVVYKRIGKYKHLSLENSGKSSEFMKKCIDLLNPYIQPGSL